MAATPLHDLYRLRPEDVEDPPRTFGGIVRRIGPGVILAGSIVGSGELIATTVLGAENGYTLLWLILVSCVIKVAVQNELGRYSIATGETTLEAFDRVPGPRLHVSWVVWCWFFMIMTTLMQIGAMFGGISEILYDMAPGVSVNMWVWILAVGTAVLLIVGHYSFVEKVCLVLVVSFTVLTVSCAVLLFKRPEYFSWASLLDGLAFHMPQGGFLTAVAVFGITGVGANELTMYPYWCIEKGYARYTGRRDESEAWRRRASGWIRVMGVDVLNCMIIYTFATVAFYLLGGGVLHGMGIVPKGGDMIKVLSRMYTETLGSWSLYLFLIGAFSVLYATLFSSTAAKSRGLADVAGMLGFYQRGDYAMRVRLRRIFVVLLLAIPAIFFMFIREPVLMVKIGGVAQASMLPVIAFSTIYLRYRHLPKAVLPSGWMTLALWVSAVVIAVMMGYSVLQRLLQ